MNSLYNVVVSVEITNSHKTPEGKIEKDFDYTSVEVLVIAKDIEEVTKKILSHDFKEARMISIVEISLIASNDDKLLHLNLRKFI